MRVVHWTAYNGSGMNAVARSMAESEVHLGLESQLMNVQESPQWELALDADIHVCHTHFPDKLRRRVTRPLKIVWVGHGTPENVFNISVEEGSAGGYGFPDGVMLMQHWLRNADARVTFWPRHQAIYQTMVDKGTKVHLVPMGIDKTFWSSGASRGKYAGAPSVWSGENCHQIKWPLDLILAWPWVYPELDGASLHLNYLPTNYHRWFAPIINGNGAGYAMHWSPLTWEPTELRNIFKSIDFFIGLVRYGDFNRLCLEANVAGCPTISYAGNPYSDYWLPEGDQRAVAKELVRILKGEVEARQKETVPDASEMAAAMKEIYEGIL